MTPAPSAAPSATPSAAISTAASPTGTRSRHGTTGRPATERPAARLRAVLGINAATSLAAGTVAAVAAPWVDDAFGFGSVGWTRVVGVGLILFAVDVALIAARARSSLRAGALAVSLADTAWVVATVVVLATVDLTTTGRVVAAVMGVGVAGFAALQLWFRRRLS